MCSKASKSGSPTAPGGCSTTGCSTTGCSTELAMLTQLGFSRRALGFFGGDGDAKSELSKSEKQGKPSSTMLCNGSNAEIAMLLTAKLEAAEAEAEDCKAESAEAEDCKSEAAEAEDCKLETAKLEAAKLDAAKPESAGAAGVAT